MAIKEVNVKRFGCAYSIGGIKVVGNSAKLCFAFDDDHFVYRWKIPDYHLIEMIAHHMSFPCGFSINKWRDARYSLIMSLGPSLTSEIDAISKDSADDFFSEALRYLGGLSAADYLRFLKENPAYIPSTSDIFTSKLLDELLSRL